MSEITENNGVRRLETITESSSDYEDLTSFSTVTERSSSSSTSTFTDDEHPSLLSLNGSEDFGQIQPDYSDLVWQNAVNSFLRYDPIAEPGLYIREEHLHSVVELSARNSSDFSDPTGWSSYLSTDEESSTSFEDHPSLPKEVKEGAEAVMFDDEDYKWQGAVDAFLDHDPITKVPKRDMKFYSIAPLSSRSISDLSDPTGYSAFATSRDFSSLPHLSKDQQHENAAPKKSDQKWQEAVDTFIRKDPITKPSEWGQKIIYDFGNSEA